LNSQSPNHLATSPGHPTDFTNALRNPVSTRVNDTGLAWLLGDSIGGFGFATLP
jgi:hypothetical protein